MHFIWKTRQNGLNSNKENETEKILEFNEKKLKWKEIKSYYQKSLSANIKIEIYNENTKNDYFYCKIYTLFNWTLVFARIYFSNNFSLLLKLWSKNFD